jgi:hypothetical protein
MAPLSALRHPKERLLVPYRTRDLCPVNLCPILDFPEISAIFTPFISGIKGRYGKIRFREKDPTGIEDRLLAKEARLNALWNGRLGHQMEALPQYDEVFRTVRRELRQAAFPK